MKVETSRYLQEKKPMLQDLLHRLLQEYPYVSILAEDSRSCMCMVSKSGTLVREDDMLTGRGAVIRVYDGTSVSEYALNRFCEEEFALAQKTLRETLVPLGKKLPDGIQDDHARVPADDPCVFHESTSYERHPSVIGDAKILDALTRISEEGRAVDSRILDCRVVFSWQQYSKLFLSEHRDMLQDVMWTNGYISAVAAHGEKVESCARAFSMLGGAELLDQMEHGVEDVARTTLELLDSQPMKPGEYECICTPEVTGMIAHEAFGHGVEMDMFVKDRALAKQYIGKQVASPLVTMHDGASAAKETASYFFDDEGVLAHDTVVIEHGILKQGISDSRSAQRLGTEPTGNGRREAFDHKVYTRMTNTFFEPGTDRYEDMVKSISYGFQLENATSGMEDPKNWGIQCMVNIAREIKDGAFTGRIFSPVVLTGYVPDLLKSISMISDRAQLCGCGMCGKGHKEWVKVSDGGPYIKAKIRLG